MEISIKNKADLEHILGKKLSNNLLKVAKKPNMKRVPMSVYFKSEKPKFYIDNGGSLYAYAVNLETSEIIKAHYCGSGNSSINHQVEQFSDGYSSPDNAALIFVERFQSSSNCAWIVTVVSNNFIKAVS
jgi:hypothetical protein